MQTTGLYLRGFPDNSQGRDIALYTAQPAPVVDADDNFYSWFGREWEQYYQPNNYSLSAKKHLGAIAESAWFACRAAMLQAGNSPVTPDGWIPVSERMPEFFYSVLVTDEYEDMAIAIPVGLLVGDKCAFRMSNDDIFLATHWMPLPAAPQQEVKS
ncbi:DUF551 domain-containing protein [Salmonella enterica]